MMLKVHVPRPATVPLVSAIVRVEEVVVRLFVPPQTELVESEMVRPAGKVSVKLTLLIAVGPGLVMVKVRVDVPPGLTEVGANALEMLAFTILAMRAEDEKSAL